MPSPGSHRALVLARILDVLHQSGSRGVLHFCLAFFSLLSLVLLPTIMQKYHDDEDHTDDTVDWYAHYGVHRHPAHCSMDPAVWRVLHPTVVQHRPQPTLSTTTDESQTSTVEPFQDLQWKAFLRRDSHNENNVHKFIVLKHSVGTLWHVRHIVYWKATKGVDAGIEWRSSWKGWKMVASFEIVMSSKELSDLTPI